MYCLKEENVNRIIEFHLFLAWPEFISNHNFNFDHLLVFFFKRYKSENLLAAKKMQLAQVNQIKSLREIFVSYFLYYLCKYSLLDNAPN